MTVRTRFVLEATGGFLLAMAVAIAWFKPDGVTVAAFVGAALLLLFLTLNPKWPTKITLPGGSGVEYGEAAAASAFARRLEEHLSVITMRIAQSRPQPADDEFGEGVGATWAGFDVILESARNAHTPEELSRAVQDATAAADAWGAYLERALRQDPNQPVG